MKSKQFLVVLAFVLPLVFVGTACAHKPDEKSGKRTIVYVNDKEHGWLGVSIEDVTGKLARRKNLKVTEGAYVSDVESDSPADEAGIKEGDVIVEFDGKKVDDYDDLTSAVRATKPGSDVMIGVVREGDKRSLKATIGKMPPGPRMFSFNIPPVPRIHIAPHAFTIQSSGLYGLRLEELNRQLGEYFGAPDGRGVLVKSVARNSAGEKAGFKAGDVIVKVGKEPVTDVEDITSVFDDYKDGDKADIEILRKGNTQKLAITIDERERDLSFRRFDGDDGTEIDMYLPDEGRHFRGEAEHLKHEMEKLKENLHDRMYDLKEKLRRQIEKIRESVNV